MQYALLVYERAGAYADFSDEQRRSITAEYMTLQADPRIVDGAQLKSVESTTTVRVVDGECLITDGPFADTKEVFGGYYILEVEDIDAALEIAARIPAARLGGAVELRPVVARPR